jgi:hypothetical protein
MLLYPNDTNFEKVLEKEIKLESTDMQKNILCKKFLFCHF